MRQSPALNLITSSYYYYYIIKWSYKHQSYDQRKHCLEGRTDCLSLGKVQICPNAQMGRKWHHRHPDQRNGWNDQSYRLSTNFCIAFQFKIKKGGGCIFCHVVLESNFWSEKRRKGPSASCDASNCTWLKRRYGRFPVYFLRLVTAFPPQSPDTWLKSKETQLKCIV